MIRSAHPRLRSPTYRTLVLIGVVVFDRTAAPSPKSVGAQAVLAYAPPDEEST
jgi:hypothetical protein